MKNLLTIIFIAILSFGISLNASAQEDDSQNSKRVNSKGSHGEALNLFVSFGNVNSVSGHYEIGLTQDITISPAARIRFGDETSFAIGARADYYFDRLLKLAEPWDIYAGIDTMFDFDTDFDIHGHMGVEFFLTDSIGLIGEFGFGDISTGTLGVGIHF